MDLQTLSLDELKKLQNDVAVTIFNFEKRKKAKAAAKQLGLKFERRLTGYGDLQKILEKK